jgi:hypothetical protein
MRGERIVDVVEESILPHLEVVVVAVEVLDMYSQLDATQF